MGNTETKDAIFAAALMLAALAPSAHAGSPSYRQVCKADYLKFCVKTPFNAAKCMRTHAADLSDACKAAWLAHEQASPDATNAAAPTGQ